MHIEARTSGAGCEGAARRVKDRPAVELVVDLPCFGRPARLVWHKHRWRCPDDHCPVGSSTGEESRIAPTGAAMTDRAGRWVCEQVGRLGRTVAAVTRELASDWHTVNDACRRSFPDRPGRQGSRPTLGSCRRWSGACPTGASHEHVVVRARGRRCGPGSFSAVWTSPPPGSLSPTGRTRWRPRRSLSCSATDVTTEAACTRQPAAQRSFSGAIPTWPCWRRRRSAWAGACRCAGVPGTCPCTR